MSKILQFLIPFVICVTSTKAFTTCRLTDGRLLRNGTSAFVSCDTKCTCLIYPSYYHVLCEATCLGNVTTSGCSLVRKPGDFCCVRQNQCPTDVKLDQCLTVNSTTEDRTIPWHIRIKNDGVEKCAGVMVPPSRSVITKMGCANENSILIGNNGKTYAAQVIKNEPQLKIITLIAVNSHKNIMPGFHEINPAPNENFCRSYPTTNCALFVSYFDSNSGKSGRLAGVLSNDVQCVNKSQSPNTKCVQVAQAPGACRNLTSGSGVYVQVNDFPYLVGILAVDHTCIQDGPAMIPFYDVCNDIENLRHDF